MNKRSMFDNNNNCIMLYGPRHEKAWRMRTQTSCAWAQSDQRPLFTVQANFQLSSWFL